MNTDAQAAAPATLDYIDAARGIAVLMVLMIHVAEKVADVSPWLDRLAQYGQMGVQLFFVASALTLCMSASTRRDGPAPHRKFFVRRFFRIAPLYYLAIPIYFVFSVVAESISGGPVTYAPYTPVNVLANVLFVHGFYSPANNSVVPGGWSIGTEMAFYACFPLLYFVCERLSSRDPRMILVLALLCFVYNFALQYAIRCFTTHGINNNSFLYYVLTNHLPVFIFGMYAHFSRRSGRAPALAAPQSYLAGFVGLTILALTLWGIGNPLIFTVIPTLAGLSFLCLIRWLSLQPQQSAALCHFGRLSYSMYILHFLFAWGLVPATVGRLLAGVLPPDVLLPVEFACVVALTMPFAQFTQRIVEAPGIAIGRVVAQRVAARASRRLSGALVE